MDTDVTHSPLPVYVTTTVPAVPLVVSKPVASILAKVLGLTLHVPPNNVELNCTVDDVQAILELFVVITFVHGFCSVVTVIVLVFTVEHTSDKV